MNQPYTHIYTHFTNIAIQKLDPNTILGTTPPEIHHSEHALPRADRVHLNRLRRGHHTEREWMITPVSVDEVCLHCNTSTNCLTHIMTHCPAVQYRIYRGALGQLLLGHPVKGASLQVCNLHSVDCLTVTYRAQSAHSHTLRIGGITI